MARRPKKEREQLAEVVILRCSAAQKKHWRDIADTCGLSVSDYVRTIADTGRTVAPKTARALPVEVWRELNRIGVNLNQIARVANASGQIDTARLDDTLERINTILDEAEGIGPAHNDR